MVHVVHSEGAAIEDSEDESVTETVGVGDVEIEEDVVEDPFDHPIHFADSHAGVNGNQK